MNRNMPDEMVIVDFAVHNYETFRKTFSLETGSGAKADLSGRTVRGQVRPDPTSSTLTASFTCSVSTASASLTIELASEITAGITPGEYVYDVALCWRESGKDCRKYLVGGKLTVLPSVTH